MNTSYVTYNSTTYFSQYSRREFEPHSSLTQLIQGVWAREPRIARMILRNRIYTTEELSPMNWGMLKTGAQRASVVEQAKINADSSWNRVTFVSPYQSSNEKELLGERSVPPMKLAQTLASLSHRQAEAYLSDRAVGCVLELNGRIVARAHNTNRSNRCLHAEVNLIQSWWRAHQARIPAGARLHSTLQPCRMCHGMLEECAPGIEVEYLESDDVPQPPWKSKIRSAVCEGLLPLT